MIRNILVAPAFCLCAAPLFAQQNADTTGTRNAFNGRTTKYSYNGSADDLHRKRAGKLMDSIRNTPEWRAESEGFSADFYNSAAWKKSKEESSKALPLWDTHSTTGNKAWQEAVGLSNAELENSEAYKIYQPKRKDFNKRLDRETMKQLYKDDPRYKTAF